MEFILQNCPCCGKKPAIKLLKCELREYNKFSFEFDLMENSFQILCTNNDCDFNSFYKPEIFDNKAMAFNHWNLSVTRYKK
jgi:hypothetical protein